MVPALLGWSSENTGLQSVSKYVTGTLQYPTRTLPTPILRRLGAVYLVRGSPHDADTIESSHTIQ